MTATKPLPSSHDSGKIAMIRCPAGCKAQFHPAKMKVCPYTGVPLRAVSVEEHPTSAPTCPETESPKIDKRRFKIPKSLSAGAIAILLVLVVVVGLIYVLSSKGSRAPVIPRAGVDGVQPGRTLDTSRMVPIRNLPGRNVWIDEFEVTIGEYQEVMGGRPSVPDGLGDLHPVVNVSYAEAEEYAKQVSKRLCTEDEWRSAAGVRHEFSRAVVDRARSNSGGDNLPQDRHYTLDKSEIGAYNLLGNVSEWIDGSGSFPKYIGASWQDPLTDQLRQLETVDRRDGSPAPFIGFRCCVDMAPVKP